MENNEIYGVQKKPILIQVGRDVSLHLTKKENFSNNRDYLGHDNNDVPVFRNEKLNNKEIKNIMENNDIKKLNDGNYEAIVRQVYNKDKENGKKIVLMELDVKGQNDYQYITFFIEGYSQKSQEISMARMDEIKKKFEIEIIEQMEGKEVTLTVKTNENGFTNMYLSPKREFYDWTKELKHDGEAKFDCLVKKFYKTMKGNKYNFIVEINIDGKIVTEFVLYDLDFIYNNEKVGQMSFERALNKLGVTADQEDVDINKPAKLIVKRITKGDKVFFNKKLAWDKPTKEHYWK